MFLLFLEGLADQAVLRVWLVQKLRYVIAASLIVYKGQQRIFSVSHHHDGTTPMNFKAP